MYMYSNALFAFGFSTSSTDWGILVMLLIRAGVDPSYHTTVLRTYSKAHRHGLAPFPPTAHIRARRCTPQAARTHCRVSRTSRCIRKWGQEEYLLKSSGRVRLSTNYMYRHERAQNSIEAAADDK